MAIPHAQPLEVINVSPFGSGLAAAKTTALIKTNHMEVIRLVLPAGKELSEHKAPGDILMQCLEGRVAFTSLGKTVELGPGQLVFLPAAEPHSVRAIEDTSFLLTILLP
jgi:quercetin dioxygenase-like cupin family protein